MYKRLLNSTYEDSTNIRRNRVLLASIPALQTTMSPAYQFSAWRGTGLYPFHPERILESSLVSNDLSDDKDILPGNKKRKMTWFHEGDSEKGEVVRVHIFPDKSYRSKAE